MVADLLAVAEEAEEAVRGEPPHLTIRESFLSEWLEELLTTEERTQRFRDSN